MRLREFKNPVQINEVVAAPIVAAWPWLVGLFGAATATATLQQNPEAVEKIADAIVKNITADPKAMSQADRDALMRSQSPIMSAIKDTWEFISTTDEQPSQAEINKRVSDALDAAGQRAGGKATQDILNKYKPGTVDPSLQKAADAERAEHEKLISTIINRDDSAGAISKSEPAPDIITKRDGSSAGTVSKVEPNLNIIDRVPPTTKTDTDPAPKVIGRTTPTTKTDTDPAPKVIGRTDPSAIAGTDTPPKVIDKDKDGVVTVPGTATKPGTVTKPIATPNVVPRTVAPSVAKPVAQVGIASAGAAIAGMTADEIRKAAAGINNNKTRDYLYKGKKDIPLSKVVKIGKTK